MKQKSENAKPSILTCAQPSGRLTLGNYLGAIRNWAGMLDDHECFFGIVDMHAITARCVPKELRANTLSCLAQYLACGLDPARSHIFVQSHVIGHAELAWVLACLTPIGDLQRMTQFKEKASKLGFLIKESDEANPQKFEHSGSKAQASVNAGLLYYPVLMAADILLYGANRVPVGDDQRQHLELCRDLAARFNQTYSDTFPIPEAYIPAAGARIMSLQNPTRKMSKSDEQQNGTLYLLDDPKVLRRKIMSAVTDSGTEIRISPDQPGVTNLLRLYASATGEVLEVVEESFAGKGYAELKGAVADAVISLLEPVQKRYADCIDDKDYLFGVLKEGAEAAQARAYKTLSKVYRKVGFVERPR